MDTKFWGKDGWKFLHSVVSKYPDIPTEYHKHIYGLFFNCIKYVLPCIYCRKSFDEFTKKLPIDLTNNYNLSKWLFDIHNLVNDKLKNQGNVVKYSDGLESVMKFYENYVNEINESDCINMPGWDFIYCIYFNYPKHEELLNFDVERLTGYATFLLLFSKVNPFKNNILFDNEIKNIDTNLENLLTSRDNLTKLIYNLEMLTSEYTHHKCNKTYTEKCKYIESYRAGCSNKTKTCSKDNLHKIIHK